MSTTLQSMMSKNHSPPKGWGGFWDKVGRAMATMDTTDARRLEAHKALLGMGSEPVNKANNQVGSSGIYGGYTVPPDFNLAVATSYEEECFLYPRATVIPMLSRTMQLPRVNAETAQAAGTPPWWGGMNFSWGITASSGVITQTNPTLAQNELVARNLIGTVIASQDLHQDIQSGGEEFLFNMFARGAAYAEEYAFFNGMGGSQHQPQGIFTADGFYEVARDTALHVKTADIQAMAAHMTPRGWMHAIWVLSPSVITDVMGVTGFIPNQAGIDSFGVSAIGSILGRPAFVSDKVPAIGHAGDVSLIDPTQYLIGERAELIVQISDENKFTTNQVVYRVWRRVDGQTLFSHTITATDGATVISPFVGLSTKLS